MTSGIYAYIDKTNNMVVYVGQDSNIDKNQRHKDHMKPYLYNAQKINQVLQNNPDRYTYQVLVWDVKDQETLNALEIQYIRQLNTYHYSNPRGFNFTLGGDGASGYTHNDESKKKMSESKKGIVPWNKGKKTGQVPWNKNKKLSKEHKQNISESLKGEKHPNWGKPGYWRDKKFSEEHKQKLSESRKGEKHWTWGKTRPEETRQKISESKTKDYARIIKHGYKNSKPYYAIRKDGKFIKHSIYPSRLIEWFVKEYPNEDLYYKEEKLW